MSPFTRENYIDAIKNALAYLKAQVELNNAINKYSINIEAETFYAGFLNVVYGFSLKNGNHTERNIPSIDLYEECQRDDGQRVAVQVTSNNDAKKVKKTLESFCSYDYQKDYTRLIILMITEKKNYRSTFAFPADIGIQFDQSRDIVDVYDLIQNIEQTTETDHLRSIYEYLAKELPSWIIRIRDTEDKRPRETELYDRLFSIFENDRKNHPSIRMMDPDPSLFPKGLPEIFSDGRLAVEEEEEPRAIRDMILDSWKREDRRHILLIGEGGIGKTVAMLTLPVENWFKKLGIPVIYVPLQRLDAFHGDLNRYIREKIGYDNYDCCIEQANSISEGHPRLLLLLDGFNEIPDKYKKDAEKCIREWMEKPGVQIITTSRMGYFQENSFLKYQLQTLPYDTVRSFLLSAGIVEEQIPEQNDKIWKVINVPLMLTIYTQIEKVREADRFSAVQIFEWKQPENAARIIWNYLQTELYRCIKKQDPSHSALQYAAAILAVAPYVCCQMSYQYKFYIDMDEFHGLIREALNFYATHQNLLSRQMTNLRQKYDRHHEENLFRQEDAAEYARILIDNLALFQEQETYKEESGGEDDIDYIYSLMHQIFRDALAAFFICSSLPKACDAKEKKALLNQADYYVRDYMAEHLSGEELVAIWNKHRMEDLEDGHITFMLMELIGRQRYYDYRELDFSGIDLTKTNLHRLLSRRLDICPFPRDKNKLRSAKISVECLLPSGYASCVNSLSFSPSGTQLAGGASDSTLLIWDLGSGEKRILEGHVGCVYSVAFSPDGRQLASGGEDGTVRIWDLESGEGHVFEGHIDSVLSVAFSPDGKQLASSAYDSTVRVWDLESGESRVLRGHAGWVYSVAFDPDGSQLASSGEDGTVRIWDLESGGSCVLEGHAGWVCSVAFDPDGSQLASSGEDGTVRVWDLESGESSMLKGHTSIVRNVTFSPDGRQLASGAEDGTVRVWNLESGESNVLEGHFAAVYSAAFSPDERQLASSAGDGAVWIWDLESGESLVLEGSVGGAVSSIAFSPDGRQIAGGAEDSTVRIWDFKSDESRVLEGHARQVSSVVFNPDGRQLASGAEDGTVRIWDLESDESRVLEGHTDWVNSVAFSPDGRLLASGTFDRTVRIWDLESGESRALEGHTDEVNSVAFSPDGRQLATGAFDRTVRVWDLESGKSRVLEGHVNWVNSVAFSPDGRQLASGAADRTVRIWDLESGKSRVLEGHTGGVNSVAFSPDGSQLASGAFESMVRVWDLESGESCVLEGYADRIWSVAFSPDGSQLASGAPESTVQVWDMQDYSEAGKYVIIPHLNLSGANFELAIIDQKDKEILKAAGAKV